MLSRLPFYCSLRATDLFYVSLTVNHPGASYLCATLISFGVGLPGLRHPGNSPLSAPLKFMGRNLLRLHGFEDHLLFKYVTDQICFHLLSPLGVTSSQTFIYACSFEPSRDTTYWGELFYGAPLLDNQNSSCCVTI